MLEYLLARIGIDVVKEKLRSYKRKGSDEQYKKLISAAIAELLVEHPDITAAEAKILAAEATGAPPSVDLLKAREILGKVKKHQKKAAKQKAAKKMAPGRKRPGTKKTRTGRTTGKA